MNARVMSSRTPACPLCYQRLPAPGMAAYGHPLALPNPADLTVTSVEVTDATITVSFASGLVASRPLGYSRRLVGATPAQRAAVEIGGDALHWPALDEDLGIAHFLGIPEDVGAAARGATIAVYPTPGTPSKV